MNVIIFSTVLSTFIQLLEFGKIQIIEKYWK